MKRLILMLMVTVMAGAPVFAQEDSGEPDEPQGIPADFTEYLKTTRPGLDPAGEHDIFNLKNPTDPDERHAYTHAMLHVFAEYIVTLRMGSTISKLFDQYARQQEGNQVTFKVLHAQVLRLHPNSKPNYTAANTLLNEAAEMDEDYAYPHYMLAEYEYGRFTSLAGQTSPATVLQLLNKAIGVRPDFLRAVIMKSQVLLLANPPRAEEVRSLLKPWLELDNLPEDPDDFDNVLKLQAESDTRDSLHGHIEKLLESDKLSDLQRIRAMMVAADVHMKAFELDDAIADLERAGAIVKPAQFPSEATAIQQNLSMCWRAKANELKRQSPDDSAMIDRFLEAAVRTQKQAAEIERQHLPKTLRGGQARELVRLLSLGMNQDEEALKWLNQYLDTTELTGPQRRELVILRRNVLNRLNPTEEGLIEQYENYLANDDQQRLAQALGLARENARLLDEHFRRPGSLRFFISQVKNRDRLVVEFAAFLAADTALQIGHQAIREAGEAIAARFEEEIELNADRQAEFQESLSRTLRDLGGPAAQARVVRHFAKILVESPDVAPSRLAKVFKVWTDESFLASLGDAAPEKPGFFVSRRPERAAEWLRKLAVVIDQHADLVHAEWAIVDGLAAVNRLQPEDYIASHVSAEVAREGVTGDLEEALIALRDRFQNVDIDSIKKAADDDDLVRVGIKIGVKDSDDKGELTIEVRRTEDGWKIASGLIKHLSDAVPEPAPVNDEDMGDS